MIVPQTKEERWREGWYVVALSRKLMLNTGLAGKRDTKWSADATKQLGIGTQAISPDQLTQLSIST